MTVLGREGNLQSVITISSEGLATFFIVTPFSNTATTTDSSTVFVPVVIVAVIVAFPDFFASIVPVLESIETTLLLSELHTISE